MNLRVVFLLIPILAVGCRAAAPPKTIRLPAQISEASGLSISGNEFSWHNDSGDGPYVYVTGKTGAIIHRDTLSATASDYEDVARDNNGNLYLGDFGNNAGKRTDQRIFRYHPDKPGTDSIVFTYPGQNGGGRDQPGNYDCEAMVWHNDTLHLFTKDQLFDKGKFKTYHFRLPATPGRYVAELVDSLHLPRRVVTAAAYDAERKELVLTAYNFKFLAGFWPSSAASLISITEFPQGHFLRGKVRRRNLSWFWPTQFEAVDFYNEQWLYVGSEGTRVRKHAVGKRKKRR
ncbi:hypothetical protein FUA23_06005 [Neolewinella aurantiaca]|uniref:Uncharacterized protein n=1 Tax=Neolewinella aurantiaca TaxID=2602767 RepID=A0A5C7FHH2_9BACT|nr:hypothetical protein [Neolewinella aurantiaca]TXF90646.1 hypothetical protein FUA23_06005 [Neolewinella aurantiaca]